MFLHFVFEPQVRKKTQSRPVPVVLVDDMKHQDLSAISISSSTPLVRRLVRVTHFDYCIQPRTDFCDSMGCDFAAQASPLTLDLTGTSVGNNGIAALLKVSAARAWIRIGMLMCCLRQQVSVSSSR